jgi:spore maturation protein CgeB
MKILVAGEGRSEIHETALGEGFRKLGHEVQYFRWLPFFEKSSLALRLQNRLLFGPAFSSLNRVFLKSVTNFSPDLIFLYRPTHLFEATIKKARKLLPSSLWAAYNNDDPFSEQQPHFFWRHFFAVVKQADLVFAYRKHNITEYQRLGCPHVELLRSWFIPERDRRWKLTEEEQDLYDCDVLFAGHFEPDGRAEMLDGLKRRGFKVHVYGPGWEDSVPLRGEAYVKSLCGARIALCFFSKLNRDSYTRRCFEIPATRTFLLSEYSEELAGMFEESKEAEFFRNPEELYEKVARYLNDENSRTKIAEAGYIRVHKDGHDSDSRAKDVLKICSSMQAN